MTLKEERRERRQLLKLLQHVTEHKKPLALVYVELVVKSQGIDKRRSLLKLESLMSECKPSSSAPQSSGLLDALRSLDDPKSNLDSNSRVVRQSRPKRSRHTRDDGGLGELVDTPSTPGGPRSGGSKSNTNIIYTPIHHTVSIESYCPNPYIEVSELASDVHLSLREHESVSQNLLAPYEELGVSEQAVFMSIVKRAHARLVGGWPKSLPLLQPVIGDLDVNCPACEGQGFVPRGMRVALEWFLKKRAIRYRSKFLHVHQIRPQDWGYEEISQIEMHPAYRGGNMTDVLVESSNAQWCRMMSPTKLHPFDVVINRWPTDTQIRRGVLEMFVKMKSARPEHRKELKGMALDDKVRGPLIVDDESGGWKCDWEGRGIGCTIVHKSSGLSSSYSGYKSFVQNRDVAERHLEPQVGAYLLENLSESQAENPVKVFHMEQI